MSVEDALARRIAEQMRASEGTAWGLELEEARMGYARVAMAVRADMLNGHGTAHGGMIFALADTAFAYACNARNQATVAASASIIFIAPARPGDRLVAEAREDAVAGRSGAYSVIVRNQDGAPIAQFHGLSRTVGGSIVNIEEQEIPHG